VAAVPEAAPARPAAARLARDRRSKEVQLDMDLLLRQGYLVRETSQSLLADQLRIIKRPLLRNVHPEGGASTLRRPNLVLVTSALPGEGKTFFAVNLAMSIAMEVDHSVLLVDADVVRPSVMSRLGVEAELGMLDVLTKPSLDLSEVLMRTNIPKLSLLPAGRPTDQSTELLASVAMERLLADLAERYADRIVIFDGPPLLATSESRVLAARMGQVLMVVQAQKTAQSSVARAFADIEACETVWCVLNKAAGQRASAGYERYPQYRRT
jgi:receptor protein-tyrosine kinase